MSKHSSRGTTWNVLRLKVLARDSHSCVYCGREANTADHVTPKSAGGKDEMSNLVACCLKCNGIKSDKPLVRTNYFSPKWIKSL